MSWDRIASDFDPRRGGLLAFGMLVILVAPRLVAQCRGLIQDGHRVAQIREAIEVAGIPVKTLAEQKGLSSSKCGVRCSCSQKAESTHLGHDSCRAHVNQQECAWSWFSLA
jgi:hypothetical protein